MGRRRLGFWRRFAVAVVKPVVTIWTRPTWSGMRFIPSEGGVIIAANHLSHFDPLVAAHYVYEAGRWPQFLGKSSLFEIPVLGSLLRAVRQIPVRRGTPDAGTALQAAMAAVRAGDVVIIYPEGTTTAEPGLWPMRGRTGVARLILATGAPVVPLVMWGPQRVFDPRDRRLRLRPRTGVTVVAGPPIDVSRWAGPDGTGSDGPVTADVLHEITDTIMLRLRDMLAEIRGDGPPPPLWTPVPGSEARGGVR